MARRLRRACFSIVLLSVILSGFSGQAQTPSAAAAKSDPKSVAGARTDPAVAEQTIVAAGDIVDCANLSGSEATAKLLDKIPGTILTVGDLAYPDGS
jgi:hypothetical protein